MSAGQHLNAALAAEADAYRALLAGEDARPALLRARDAYLASHAETGPRSWGRLLGALKMAILAGDGADAIARQAMAEVEEADSPASAYVRALAQVALGGRPDVEAMLAAGESFAAPAAPSPRSPPATGRPTPSRCARSWPTSRPATSTSRASRSPTPRSSWSGWPSRGGWPRTPPGRWCRR